jgi:hypothetical protein
MKQRIPLLIVLAALIAASVYLYPQFTKHVKPQNELVLSGNIEAHESLVSGLQGTKPIPNSSQV